MIMSNYMDIIKEVASTEDFTEEQYISTDLESKYNDIVKEMAMVSESVISYEAVMLPVFESKNKYFVELDNIVKYMNSQSITDIKEAVDNIAEANNISVSDMSVVLGSKEDFESTLEEAEKLADEGDTSLLEDCNLSIKFINYMKSNNINVVTKQ